MIDKNGKIWFPAMDDMKATIVDGNHIRLNIGRYKALTIELTGWAAIELTNRINAGFKGDIVHEQ